MPFLASVCLHAPSFHLPSRWWLVGDEKMLSSLLYPYLHPEKNQRVILITEVLTE